MHKILVVPQNLLQIELGSSFLDRKSLTVRTSDTAEAALEVIRAWQPALVIFSESLPGQSPAEFCEQARVAGNDPPVRLLMLSEAGAGGPSSDEAAAYDARLLLPLAGSQLLRTVAGLLDVRKRRAARAPLRVLASTRGLIHGQPEASGALVNTLNISEVGLLVEAPEPLTMGSSGSLRLFLPGSPTRLELTCAVQFLVDELQHHYALSLVEPSDALLEQIRAYTRKHEEE